MRKILFITAAALAMFTMAGCGDSESEGGWDDSWKDGGSVKESSMISFRSTSNKEGGFTIANVQWQYRYVDEKRAVNLVTYSPLCLKILFC